MCPHFSPDESGLMKIYFVYVDDMRQNTAEKGGCGQRDER